MDCEIVVIGAGVAGLAATAALTRTGRSVICLEAAGRPGGRVLTIHDPLAPLPVELGAEFVHGRPPQTWRVIHDAGLAACANTGHALHLRRGKVLKDTEVGQVADKVLAKLAQANRRRDETFDEFLQHSRQPPDFKKWARLYVEGFNASRAERISVGALMKDKEGAESIEGDRTFRILSGYDSVVQALLQSIPNWQSVVRLNSAVERVSWRRGDATVRYRNHSVRCARVIVTVPLGVLHANTIQFEPEPAAVLKAARALDFGQAYRVTFRFADAFWESDKRLRDVGFILSDEKLFPTWWTTQPVSSPMLTGWTAGSATDGLIGAEHAKVVDAALASLRRILGRRLPSPQTAYFHDWHADPFVRGAYSYVPANALPARHALSRPVQGTLYFAGEATEANGHGGTVHGAIAEGLRAARRIEL